MASGASPCAATCPPRSRTRRSPFPRLRPPRLHPAAAPAAPRSSGQRRRSPRRGPLADGRHRLSVRRSGSKPFVTPGERVEAGATLLIIEAMKVMNQITAPHSGTVTRVLVQNAEPVEFGQPLVIIE
jgi:acetyl-CoA carboxylase biotin carboxyl carrier protein